MDSFCKPLHPRVVRLRDREPVPSGPRLLSKRSPRGLPCTNHCATTHDPNLSVKATVRVEDRDPVCDIPRSQPLPPHNMRVRVREPVSNHVTNLRVIVHCAGWTPQARVQSPMLRVSCALLMTWVPCLHSRTLCKFAATHCARVPP